MSETLLAMRMGEKRFRALQRDEKPDNERTGRVDFAPLAHERQAANCRPTRGAERESLLHLLPSGLSPSALASHQIC
jgi:hypothetical protein